MRTGIPEAISALDKAIEDFWREKEEDEIILLELEEIEKTPVKELVEIQTEG